MFDKIEYTISRTINSRKCFQNRSVEFLTLLNSVMKCFLYKKAWYLRKGLWVEYKWKDLHSIYFRKPKYIPDGLDNILQLWECILSINKMCTSRIDETRLAHYTNPHLYVRNSNNTCTCKIQVLFLEQHETISSFKMQIQDFISFAGDHKDLGWVWKIAYFTFAVLGYMMTLCLQGRSWYAFCMILKPVRSSTDMTPTLLYDPSERPSPLYQPMRFELVKHDIQANSKYRRHSKECMWRQQGHLYMVFDVYESKLCAELKFLNVGQRSRSSHMIKISTPTGKVLS